MKNKIKFLGICMILLIGILFVQAQEETPDFIKLAQEEGKNTHQIMDNWVVGDFETDEYGNIEFIEGGKVSIKDNQGNLINSFENIASKRPNGEKCNMNINDNNGNEVISARLYTSEDTQITLNGEVYDVPKNTEIIYQRDEMPIINYGKNTYILEENKGINFKDYSNGLSTVESNSNIKITRSYDPENEDLSLGESIEKINQNKKQIIKLDENGEIRSIKNAKISYSDNLFLKSGEDTETYIYRNTECNSMHENFICMNENEETVRIKGDSEFTIDGKNNVYFSGDKGYFSLKTNKDSELEFNLETDYSGAIKNQVEIKGNGMIQNGGIIMGVSDSGDLSLSPSGSGENFPMEITPRDENNDLGDMRAIIIKDNEFGKSKISFMDRTKDFASRITFQGEAEAEPTKEPDKEPSIEDKEDPKETEDDGGNPNRNPCPSYWSYSENCEDFWDSADPNYQKQ